jgi:hypothetical protein
MTSHFGHYYDAQQSDNSLHAFGARDLSLGVSVAVDRVSGNKWNQHDTEFGYSNIERLGLPFQTQVALNPIEI